MHFDTGSPMRTFKMTSKYYNQTGITLVELMIAMTISSVLMLGVSSIYSGSKEAYKLNDEYSILQENARLAFRFLTQDIRMAGYIGCAVVDNDNVSSTLDTDNLTADQEAFINGFGTGIEGYDAANTGPGSSINLYSGATAGFNRPVNGLFTGNLDGSDVLVVRHSNGAGVKLSGNKGSANFKIQDGGVNAIVNDCHVPSGICIGDILMVSDCSKGRIFQATNIQGIGSGEIRVVHAASGTPGNNPTTWGANNTNTDDWFAPGDSEILKMGTYAYFIANGTSGQPTLKRLSGTDAAPLELVEGVENMQIIYGYDTDDDGIANQYDVAALVSNTNVVSARISLLMSTPGEIPRRNNDTKVYNMLSEDNATNVRITPNADRRIRKVFTTTIKLRNKGLIDE